MGTQWICGVAGDRHDLAAHVLARGAALPDKLALPKHPELSSAELLKQCQRRLR